MTRMLRRAALLAALAGAFLAPSGDALANHFCNGTIASSGAYVLTHNHTCPAGTAITIDSDFVNLDLGGFRVSGQGTGSVGIEVTTGSEDVFIFGGTVRGFDTGIHVGEDCDFPLVPLDTTSNVRIDGVTVRNSSSTGIELCVVGGNTQVVSSAVLHTADPVLGGGTGIRIHGTAAVTLTLVRDTFGTGIKFDLFGIDDSGYVLGTTVEDASGTGVSISGSSSFGAASYAEVSDSTIGNCSSPCAYGIRVSGEVTTLIARSTISDSFIAGIDVDFSQFAQATIEDSVVRSVGALNGLFKGAIVFRERSSGSITGTTVQNVTGGPGIHLLCSNFILVEDNLMRNVQGDGIVVDESPGPCLNFLSDADVLRGNLVVGSGGNGIVVASGRGHQVTRNAVLGSGLDGFFIGSTVTESFLTGNRAARNGDDGFQLDTADLELTGNIARRNSGWGFLTVAPVTDLGGNQANNNSLGDCDPLHLAC